MPTSTEKTLCQQVIQLISSQIKMPEERISPDCNFETDLKFDSLELVEIMAVEDKFDIAVPDETASGIKTVRQAIDAIEQAITMRNVRQQAQGA